MEPGENSMKKGGSGLALYTVHYSIEKGVKVQSGRDLVRLREMATDWTRWLGLWGTDCD